MRLRNTRFDRGRGVSVLRRPVISVGNLSLGGVGKSPMVAWIARLLVEHGHRPIIAMRGYGARPGECSDEQAEYARHLPDVPVVAAADRCRAVSAYLDGNPDADCVVLDDGFQHRRVQRALDLVLVDATRNTFAQRVFPAGFLREPLEGLRRADAVVVTRAEGVDPALASAVERHHGRPPLAWSRHVWHGLELHGDEVRREPITWLAGKRVLTLLGVGHPRSIAGMLDTAGADVVVDVPARDHERYDRPKLDLMRSLCDGLDAVVMTGKDWVKVQRLVSPPSWPVPIVVPQLALEVFEGRGALEEKVLRSSRAIE